MSPPPPSSPLFTRYLPSGPFVNSSIGGFKLYKGENANLELKFQYFSQFSRLKLADLKALEECVQTSSE